MAAGVTSGVVALVLDAHNRNGFHQQNAADGERGQGDSAVFGDSSCPTPTT